MNLEEVKRQLLERQAEVEARVARTHKHLYGRDEPVSPNFNEQIKQRENDELVQALDEGGQRELAQIRRALARLDAGDYPYCVMCGGEIGERRLQAIPFAEMCIRCASASE